MPVDSYPDVDRIIALPCSVDRLKHLGSYVVVSRLSVPRPRGAPIVVASAPGEKREEYHTQMLALELASRLAFMADEGAFVRFVLR